MRAFSAFEHSARNFQVVGRDCAAWNYDDFTTQVLAGRYGLDAQKASDRAIIIAWGEAYIAFLKARI